MKIEHLSGKYYRVLDEHGFERLCGNYAACRDFIKAFDIYSNKGE